MDKYQEEFIKNIKFYRKEKGISQEKLAELCEVGTSTISCIESNHQNPSLEMIFKIAEALSIHPADLFMRNASRLSDQKFSSLVQNCCYLSEKQQTLVDSLVQSLAENAPEYSSSK